MNLLIVDDIATNRKLLRVTLEAEGHTTLEAADGVEALQILARETVDAVISDILMPNMDGFRLCHEIRKSERLHALPFIVYSSNTAKRWFTNWRRRTPNSRTRWTSFNARTNASGN
jgi:CheY-like chemotaxis protein